MPSFASLFKQSKGKPIEFNGETLYLSDQIMVGKNFKVAVRLLSTNSEWLQVIRLRVNKGGRLLCNGEESTDFCLYETTMPPVVEVTGFAKDGILKVHNSWVHKNWMDNEVMDSWVNGAAMKKVVQGNVIRYYCNDGHPDENFDDLVFEISVM